MDDIAYTSIRTTDKPVRRLGFSVTENNFSGTPMGTTLTEAEAAFIEARCNSLLQRGGSVKLVNKAKIPDGCGRRTSTLSVTCHGKYTLPSGSDGAMFCPTYPLNQKAAAANMNASYKMGGLAMLPTTASAYSADIFGFQAWDGYDDFQERTSYLLDSTRMQKPWRVIGFNMVVNTSDAPSETSGLFHGGQLRYHPLKVGSSAGGWYTQHCIYANSDVVSYDHIYDTVIGFGSSSFQAKDGITVRTMFDDSFDKFKCSATAPNRISGVYGFDGDWSAGNDDMSVIDCTYATGRHAFPVVILENAAAGSHWVIDVALIIEVDEGFELLELGDSFSVSPYSDKLPYLKYRCNDTALYPQLTTGHSLWTVVKETVGKAGKTIYSLAKQQVKQKAKEALYAALE